MRAHSYLVKYYNLNSYKELLNYFLPPPSDPPYATDLLLLSHNPLAEISCLRLVYNCIIIYCIIILYNI